MEALLYRVRFNDGEVLENLSYDEADQMLKDRPTEWAAVMFMNYGKDLDPANEQRRKAWGM